MSNPVRPHRQQPTRLPHPGDSPGKNTGVGCHFLLHCIKVKSESEVGQSCPTLCNPIDGRPPGSPVPGNLRARTLELGCHVLLQCMKVKSESEVGQSCPTLRTPWTAAYQAPPPMGFSRQEYWSGVLLPSPKGTQLIIGRGRVQIQAI